MKKRNFVFIIALFILLLTIFLLIKFPESKNKETAKGYYINENNQTLICVEQVIHEVNNEPFGYRIITYYDNRGDSLGTCKTPLGPPPLNCGFGSECSSPNLLTNVSGERCKGINYEKYYCYNSTK